MSRDDELGVVQAVWRVYNGDLRGFHPSETPPDIEAWLRSKPATGKVQAALVAVFGELKRRQRPGRHDKRFASDETGCHPCL